MSTKAVLYIILMVNAVCLAVLSGCGDEAGPGTGTLAIDIEPDDCPLNWALSGAGTLIEGTGDRSLGGMPAGLEYTLTVVHEPGWAASDPLTQSAWVRANEVSEIQVGFQPLELGAFVEVPAGTFTMGSPEEQAESYWDERPQHQVTFTRPLLVKATAVTQHEYYAITNQRPSRHHDCDECPVEGLDLREALTFCNLLSVWDGLQPPYTLENDAVICDWTASGYRLPTESEWEYFCRAGTTTRFSFGDDSIDLNDYAWYGDNSGEMTHPVGTRQPNAWGLYDNHGNVYEMTWDGYQWYPEEPVTDPRRDPSNELRMARGGDFHWGWIYATSSWRATYTNVDKLPNLGLRVVRYADGEAGAKRAAGRGSGAGLSIDGDKGIGSAAR